MPLLVSHGRPMRADVKSHVKGCLEVRAVRDTRAGASDGVVPAGSVGYVTSAHSNFGSGNYLICWPAFYDAGRRPISAVHPRVDVEPTGRRG